MHEVTGYLELAALNSELAEANLKDTEEELHTVVKELDNCLELIIRLRQCKIPLCGWECLYNRNSSIR